jgi:hypothetical protein
VNLRLTALARTPHEGKFQMATGRMVIGQSNNRRSDLTTVRCEDSFNGESWTAATAGFFQLWLTHLVVLHGRRDEEQAYNRSAEPASKATRQQRAARMVMTINMAFDHSTNEPRPAGHRGDFLFRRPEKSTT